MELLFELSGNMLQKVNNFEAKWAKTLSSVSAAALSEARFDPVEFLQLKEKNDSVRESAMKQLFAEFLQSAGEYVRRGAAIQLETEHPHSFKRGNSRATGSLLLFRQGLRCLKIGVGWTRMPDDGIMRGGALAYGYIEHFGMPKRSENLVLTTDNEWLVEIDERNRREFLKKHVEDHLAVFLSL